jgi:16S rRNA processing protein RimM
MVKVTVSMSNRFRNSPNPDLLHVATIGRSVGLKGDLNFNLHTDFPEQFTKGATFELENGLTITLSSYNTERALVHIVGYDSPESAKTLTNTKLFTTKEATRARCKLGKGEYFWFDLPGLSVYEENTLLGSVVEIERIGAQDYLLIKTDSALINQGSAETFLIPYIDHFVQNVDIELKKITVNGGIDLLEAS